ncbi:vWA domain-containing protein [Schlesneria paludicola]|uniref:vWA domain-containing protein n=1 Tax=Schlesneria paludicola TaxID=360056 RepID=UPI00029A184D|nr:VWA domain-containing protein [Schlesneria paludicola]
MSFMHPALLAGLGLAIIPILLHLLLRAKPKRLIFPALRLIQQNRRQNVRRLQLRHLWLLLLRVLAIVLISLALTRPSLPAANYAFGTREWLSFLAVVALGLAAYFGIMHWWKRRNWPRNTFLTRRTILRGGVGTLVAVLLLLLVGWPYASRVSAEIKSPAPKVADNIPVAAVFLFDTSPSMTYRHANQTRLQVAQQIASDHLSRMPSGSKLMIAGSHESSSPVFSLDLQAARGRIDSTEINAVSLPLNDMLRTVLLAQEDDRRRSTEDQSGPANQKQDRFVREIYLFTDLAKSAWREDTSTLLHDELKRLDTVGVYLIDVGETGATNTGISGVKLLRETIPVGGFLKVDVALSATGAVPPDQMIELSLTEADGKQSRKKQEPVTLESGSERILRLEIPTNAKGRYQQGEVRVVGSDPLAIDNVAYFTFRTLPPLKVLIVAETPTVARFWQTALNVLADEKITDIRPEFVTANRFASSNVDAFDVVCLLNVSSPTEAFWNKLRPFVEHGGGLAVFLGAESSAVSDTRQSNRIDPVGYNSAAAQSVLPAELIASLPLSPPRSMDLRQTQHPFLKQFADLDENALTELGATLSSRAWKVKPQPGSMVVSKFSEVRDWPALVERRLGDGRVMLMTTSVDNVEWNDLIRTPWYFVFADQLMQYLSQQTSVRTNLRVGDEVSLPLDRQHPLKKVVLRMPDFKQRTQDVPLDSKFLLLRDLTAIGSYQVDSTDKKSTYEEGFSLNLPARECDLRRLEPTELNSLLGEGRYTVNRDPGSLERNVQTGRLGQEVYSLLVAFLIAVFALEQFTATWFYRTDEA